MRSPPKYRNTISHSAFFEQLGAKKHNPQWSWCGYNPARKLAIFTVWDDQIGHDNSYLFFDGLGDVERIRPGLPEITKVLNEVIDNDYDAYGVLIERRLAPDGKSRIKSFNQSELLVFDVKKAGDRIFGHIKDRVDARHLTLRHQKIEMGEASAVDDINLSNPGTDRPEYRIGISRGYRRDPAVRKAVLERAKGSCEYRGCGPTFVDRKGCPYLEAHHIISLAADGPDRKSNVIALCANHHREAHFGQAAERLNEEFLQIVKEMAK